MTDNELAMAAAGGDQAAFEALIERHRPRIYAVAYRITLNEDDALDAMQNVFLHLAQRIGDFRGTGSFGAWVAAVAANQAVNCLRRPSRREIPAEPALIASLLDGRTNGAHRHPSEGLELQQRRMMVNEAVKELSPQQRAIFALRLAEGIGPKEIGERLGLPAKQVRSQFQRAIAKVRETIARQTGARKNGEKP